VTVQTSPSGPHSLARLLVDAAAGRFPDPDGSVTLVPAPPGPTDAVVAFTAHHVIAADVEPDEILSRIPIDVAAPMTAPFLVWLGERLGSDPGFVDVVLVAPDEPVRTVDLDAVSLDEAQDHPRVRRAAAYRSDLGVFRARGGEGLVIVGRGLAGRWEVAIEVDAAARRSGLGRALAGGARSVVAASEPLFAQVSPGNVASLRAFLGAGYTPVASEVLFWRGGRG
jgi:hypothetical protein